MKKQFAVVLTLALLVASMAPVQAAVITRGPFTTSAVVASSVDLIVTLKKNAFDGATITSMDFGQLVDVGTGTLRSSPTSTTGTGAVWVSLAANSQGAPYSITQTGTAMSNGTTTLPTGPLVVKALYIAADNGGAAQPAGSSTPTSAGASWVGTRTLYSSNSTGTPVAVTAFYSITDDTTAGSTGAVLKSQAAGTYTGQVTFTMTTT